MTGKSNATPTLSNSILIPSTGVALRILKVGDRIVFSLELLEEITQKKPTKPWPDIFLF
jgi:hypothetical protein